MNNLATKPILKRIERLAAKEYRTFAHQLLAMTELYEKTHGVSGKITRKRRKTQSKQSPKQEIERRARHGNLGRSMSKETKEKMRASAIRRWEEHRAKQASQG
jgi:hypothetical protein